MSSQVTSMSEGWGKDVTRLMSLSSQAERELNTRIHELSVQNQREHERLHERIEGMTQRQTVLMTSMVAMEAQMRELVEEEKTSVSASPSLADRLPQSLYEEPIGKPSPRLAVQDSVASPIGKGSQKGSGSSDLPKKPPMIQYTRGAEPEFSMHSSVAPATRMVSHMGTEDTHPEVAGTSGGGGTGGAAASVGVG